MTMVNSGLKGLKLELLMQFPASNDDYLFAFHNILVILVTFSSASNLRKTVKYGPSRTRVNTKVMVHMVHTLYKECLT